MLMAAIIYKSTNKSSLIVLSMGFIGLYEFEQPELHEDFGGNDPSQECPVPLSFGPRSVQ